MERLLGFGRAGGTMTQWYERKPGRLKKERAVLARKFPHFKLFKSSNGNFKLKGVLKTRRGNEYLIEVITPKNYPNQPPQAYVVKPNIRRAKHQFKNGSLCLFYSQDGCWTPNSTLVTIIARAAGWLHAYETWNLTGTWPGPEVTH